MLIYFLRRLLVLIPIWLSLVTLIFLMQILVPGDPVEVILFNQPSSPEVVANLRHEFGLDKSLPERYINYLGGLSHFDLGKSYTTRRPVVTEIGDRYLKTMLLAVSSLVIGLTLGLTVGTLAAVFKGSFLDVIVTGLSLVGLSLTPIWLGLAILNFFGLQLGILPVVGQGDLVHLIMPAMTLGIIEGSVLTRFVRSALLEVLSQDYIRTAYSKGLGQLRVLNRHALKNALIPVVTVFGLQLAGTLGGALIIENIFSWPGLGQLAVRAISQRDYPVIEGMALLVATTFVVINLTVDMLYGVIDPRVASKSATQKL